MAELPEANKGEVSLSSVMKTAGITAVIKPNKESLRQIPFALYIPFKLSHPDNILSIFGLMNRWDKTLLGSWKKFGRKIGKVKEKIRGHLTMRLIHPAPTEWEASSILRCPSSASYNTTANSSLQPLRRFRLLSRQPRLIRENSTGKDPSLKNNFTNFLIFSDSSNSVSISILNRWGSLHELLGFRLKQVNRLT